MNRLSVIYTSPDDPTYPYFTFHEQIMSVGYSDPKPILFILDAALECGFGSSSGFYKSFHEITGKTPSEFIKSEFKNL